MTEEAPTKKIPKGKPFEKGKSGNPKGRPKKGECLTSLLKEEMEKVCDKDKEGRTYAQLLVQTTVRLAMQGNSTALKEVWERVDGKVKQDLEIEGTVTVVRFPVRAKTAEEWRAQEHAAEEAGDGK